MVQLKGLVRPVSYLRQQNYYYHHQKSRIKPKKSSRIYLIILLTLWLPGSLDNNGVLACGPGRGGGRRPLLRKLTPLVFKQHVPNVSENTLPASGLSEGRVSRHDSKFRDLVPNYNADIIFKDEEGTGADRLMTQRCKEKLNTLAISVMNQWPGVKLRVTEGWDEEGKHATDSLHYEGRAVDVTTSDRDRSKYGMLARLAIEAGFDWVYYESRSHIHCSVKSESSSAGKSGGCFPGKSHIRTSDGVEKKLSELKLGEKIAALNSKGDIVFSEVIAFLDRSPEERRQFIRLTTASGNYLTLTPTHLIPVKTMDNEHSSRTTFADRIKVGDMIIIQQSDDYYNNINISNNNIEDKDDYGGGGGGGGRKFTLRWDKVIDVKLVLEDGVFAPLTNEGTVIVDDVVASCYAIVDSQIIAHYAFMPFRIISSIESSIQIVRQFIWPNLNTNQFNLRTNEINNEVKQPHGIHWYASFLYSLGSYVLPSSFLH